MHVPAGGLAGGEQALQGAALAALIGAHPTHRIMLRRAHRDQLLRGVDTEKIIADLAHLAQPRLDVLAPQQADIQPQVFAEAGARRMPRRNMLLHAPRHHVARGELGLVRLVIGHETVPVAIEHQATIATAALGDQDPGRKYRGRMKLDGLHVAERRAAGLEGDRGPHALVDHRVGRDPVETPETAGGDAGRACHVGDQLAAGKIARNRAATAPALVDQRQRFHALVHRDPAGQRLVAHREQHRMPGAVGDIAGAPFPGAAEIARGDQAVGLIALAQGDTLAVDHHLMIAALHPVPRHTPGRELAHRLRGGIHEHAHHVLVGAPVAAAHGVGEMHILVVAIAHHGIAEACLHAALRGR